MGEASGTHRRFQFGLGTLLLLVAVFAVWLRWEQDVVRARKACLAQIYHGQWDGGGPGVFKLAPPPMSEHATIPFWRSLLGDEPVDFIVLGMKSPPEDLKMARELIPEARIYRQAPGGALLEE